MLYDVTMSGMVFVCISFVSSEKLPSAVQSFLLTVFKVSGWHDYYLILTGRQISRVIIIPYGVIYHFNRLTAIILYSGHSSMDI